MSSAKNVLEQQLDADFPSIFWWAKDRGSRAAHHLDYERPEYDTALCGQKFSEVVYEGEARPRSVCRECQARLPAHAAREWERRARAQMALRADAETQIANIGAQLRSAERDMRKARGELTVLDLVDKQEMPLFWYVRDDASRVAHQLDYEWPPGDQGLCGHPFGTIVWQGEDRPRAVCRACQIGFARHEIGWLRARERSEGARHRTVESKQTEKIERQQKELRLLNERLRELGSQAQGAQSVRPQQRLSGKSARNQMPIPSATTSWLAEGYKAPVMKIVHGGLPGTRR